MGGIAALLVRVIWLCSGGIVDAVSAGAAVAAAVVVAWRRRSMAMAMLVGGTVYAVIELGVDVGG